MENNYTKNLLEHFKHFLTTPIEKLVPIERNNPDVNAIKVFRDAANNVPAYSTFLRDNAVDPSSINNIDDFRTLPLITKANYCNAYPLADRCRNGVLSSADIVAISSGTTGTPTYWPRSISDEVAVATRFEHIFRFTFKAHRISTLAVVCFPLGVWIGGLHTIGCLRYLNNKGYKVTVVSPGNNIDEILRIVADGSLKCEQMVLIGYPPFIRMVIDIGQESNIDWPSLNIKFVFAGEGFSEEWRECIHLKVGTSNHLFTSSSLYGTADAGVLGNETPLSVAIRQLMARDPAMAKRLFGISRLPTLVQYDPSSRFFEVLDGQIVLTTGGMMPLVRYNIADIGGILPHDELMSFLIKSDVQPDILPKDFGKLPFVYLFGRADETVSFFGANIFPENIAVGLNQHVFRSKITGKFVLCVNEDEEGQKELVVVVELTSGTQASDDLSNDLAESITSYLCHVNSEFTNYVPKERQRITLLLRPDGDSAFFGVKGKHRYVKV